MKNELIEAEVNMPALPEQFSEKFLNEKFKSVEDEVKTEVFDVNTEDGRKRIREVAKDINKSKNTIDTPIRDYLRIIKQQPKVLEKLAKTSKDNYEALRENVLKPLNEAQQYQDELLNWLNQAPQLCASPEATSEFLEFTISEIEKIDRSALWPELKKKFDVAIENAATTATITLERVKAAEAQAAELELLRKQQAEAAQAEHDRKVAEQAAESARQQAQLQAQQEREAVERRAAEAKQREEQAVLRAEQAKKDAIKAEFDRIQREKDYAEQQKQAAIDAEEKQKQAVIQAQENERKRAEEEAAEHGRLAKAREADKEHRIKINRGAMVALIAGGLSEEDAKAVVIMVAKKQVPNISIQY